MSLLNIIFIVAAIILFFAAGIWFTRSKFKNIEKGETDRRKHIEEDVKIEDREKQ